MGEKKNIEQLSLFCISTKKNRSYSYTAELYDLLPKYISKQSNKERLITRVFIHRGKKYSITVSPATIINSKGEIKTIYPKAREEIVEDAIRKIALDNNKSLVTKDGIGVLTSIGEIRKELTRIGHGYNWSEIKESLDVCSSSSLQIKLEEEDGAVLSSPMIPTVIYQNGKEEEKNQVYVSFHSLITKSIKNGEYRLINYNSFMKYSNSISRWLHKRISHMFSQAEVSNPYKIKLSTVIRDSGTAVYSKTSDSMRKIEKSLAEMIKVGTLLKYEVNKIPDEKRKNRIKDVLFSLWLSEEFCNDIKKGNYLKSKNISNLEQLNKPKSISTELIYSSLKTELNSPEYNLPTGYIETYLLKNTTQEQIDSSLLSIKAAKEYILKLEQEKQVASSSKARIIKKALSEGWKPETQESVEANHKTEPIPEDSTKWHTSKNPEHQKNFDKFLKLLKDRVGEATYDSWFKLNLQSIESEEIVLGTKSKLYSQELTNKYESIITEISLKIFNKKFCKILPK